MSERHNGNGNGNGNGDVGDDPWGEIRQHIDEGLDISRQREEPPAVKGDDELPPDDPGDEE